MRFTSTSLAALASAALPVADAYIKGANIGANNPDGSCKSTDQWRQAFNDLKSLPTSFTEVRLYASSDCNTLANAVPAALDTNTGIMVGVWAEDDTHFGNEKAALLSAIQAHGHDWITAISVGSEDLYRAQDQGTGETNPSKLAQQIYDVRGMVRAQGVAAPVGHVDTWTAWVNGANTAVITACDFVGMDGYPYWQGSDINGSKDVFFQSYQATKNAVSAAGSSAWVWITETSWPVSGATQAAAVPSVANAQQYWSETICELFNSGHTYFYAYQDYNAAPSFGLFGSNGQPLYNTAC